MFLLGGLIFLISFFASAVKLLAVTHVKVPGVPSVGLAVDLVDR